MKRLFQIAVIALGVLVLLGFGTVMYFQSKWPLAFPETPFPKIKASSDSAVIARGKYLYLAVAHCNACHAAPGEYFHRLPEDMESLQPKGGYPWELGPLGTIRSRNITPHEETGIGKWTDAELARVIQYGIKPNHVAAPFMFAVGPMADPDLTALISYLRTLPPVENQVEPTQFSWMGKVLLQTALRGFIQPKPQDPGLVYVPRGEESEARGRYLANGPGMCFGCHSESAMSPELVIVGPRFAGNRKADPDVKDPNMEIVAPNLTPHPETGQMAGWSREDFIARFRKGRNVEGSPMPWENFRLMTDEDLGSLYLYLMSLKPVNRNVGPTHREKGWKTPDT